MAGIKGRSGLKKGQTNNPDGRPAGALGKVVKEKITVAGKVPNIVALRDRISTYLYDDWDNFVANLETVDRLEALKIKKDLYKTVLPRPSDPKDADANNTLSTALAKFFNIKAEDADK